jgi:hypothetical protein
MKRACRPDALFRTASERLKTKAPPGICRRGFFILEMAFKWSVFSPDAAASSRGPKTLARGPLVIPFSPPRRPEKNGAP